MCETWLPPSLQTRGSFSARFPRVPPTKHLPQLAPLSIKPTNGVLCLPLSPPSLVPPLLLFPLLLPPRHLGPPRPLGAPRFLGGPRPSLSPACPARANVPCLQGAVPPPRWRHLSLLAGVEGAWGFSLPSFLALNTPPCLGPFPSPAGVLLLLQTAGCRLRGLSFPRSPPHRTPC